MFAAAKTGGVVAGTSGDPYWTSVSLLTNFENNLTFQDGSTNNFAITRNGVVNPSLNTPFSGVGGSEWFNGSTGYVSGTTSTAAEFGTGDFTVEAWAYMTANASGNYNMLFATSGLNMYFGIVAYLTAPLYRLTAYDGTTTLEQTAGTSFTLNAWNHVAWVRSGTTFTAYLNGSSVYSTTNSKNITGTTGFQVGHSPSYPLLYYWTGNISNLRVVKGSAVYTANFTPSTTPLTAITNTSLLITGTGQGMFDNATFVDQGPNALTMSVGGSAVYSGLSPFGNTYPGSIYCPTLNDFVTGITADNLSASDWTFEAWVNISTFVTSSNSGNIIISKCVTPIVGNFGELTFAATTNGAVIYIRPTTGAGQAAYQATSAITANTWTHVAAVYTNSTTTLKLYKNGTLTDTFTSVTNGGGATTTRYGIGQYGNGYAPNAFSGYISNARVAKTAVYTANFTPSTTPLTAITNTSLLVRGDTGAFYDLSTKGLAETGTGAPAVTTQIKKFGNESIFLNGSSYLSVANSTAIQFGSGDTTIEFWINVTSTAGIQQIINTASSASANLSYAILISSGSLFYYLSSNGTTWDIASGVAVGAITANTWTYVALVRSGNTWTPYVNSVAGTTTTNAAALFNFTSAIPIGQNANAQYVTGYLDDIRITKGVARTITTPTVTFPTGP